MKKFKVTNAPFFIYIIGASVMFLLAFFILGNQIDGMNSKIVFYGSIITTGSAIVTPLFSLKIFKLNSYKVKIYSITFGVILGIVFFYLNESNNSVAVTLFEYSSKGLLWVVNITLLLLNLAYLEIENHELIMKNQAEELLEVKKKLVESEMKRIESLEKTIDLQNKNIESKGDK